jgi:hypothetical protein
LAGFVKVEEIESDLADWDHGDYEGQRAADIRATDAGLESLPRWISAQ